jgi:hypothetical protein
MADDFQSRLLTAFAENTWPVLTRGVREGIQIADDVRRSTPFLSSLVGRDQRGMLRRAGIMWRIKALCDAKELPFKATEVLNDYSSSHLLSIVSGQIELHIVRTEDADAFPVDALIRQDRRATNIPDLFTDPKIISLAEVMKNVPRLYGWIAWGATRKGELTHLCLEMPEPDQNIWLAHKDILRSVIVSHPVESPDDANEAAPNPALLLKFKHDIATALETKVVSGGDEEDV